MAAPRGYWLTAKGHCTSRQLVATRKGPAPMGILRTHNKPQLLRPHRQVFSHPPPWALCRRPTGMCFAHVLSTYSNARESCAARENYWLSQQRKLFFPPAAKLIPRTDAAMWLKRYSGLLRLHAALLSPAEEFLLRPAGNGSNSSLSSPQLLSSAALCLRAAPAPRTPFTFYTTGTATRCTVQATPRYSLIPVPQFTLS